MLVPSTLDGWPQLRRGPAPGGRVGWWAAASQLGGFGCFSHLPSMKSNVGEPELLASLQDMQGGLYTIRQQHFLTSDLNVASYNHIVSDETVEL